MNIANNWKAGRKVRITYLHPEDGLGAYFHDIVGEEFITGDRPFRFFTNPYRDYKGIIGDALEGRKKANDECLMLIFSKDTQFEYIDMNEKPKFRIPDLHPYWVPVLLVIISIAVYFSTILETDDNKGFFGTAFDAIAQGDVWALVATFFTFVVFAWAGITFARWFK